jgi:glutaminase
MKPPPPPPLPSPSATAWTRSKPPLLRFLNGCHEEFAAETGGEVADYIPELGKADPAHFGISLATLDGHVYEVGDTRVPFTIQSMSKPFVFALALDTLGAARVESEIGVEPSGDPFNSIRLNAENHPFNPMVNAGAIACSGLIFESKATPRSTISARRSAALPAARSKSTKPSTLPKARPATATARSPISCVPMR